MVCRLGDTRHTEGFPGGASGKELSCQGRRCKEMQVPSLRWEDFPGGGHGYPFPVSLPGESLERRRLVGHSPEGCKESDRTEVT